MQGGPHILPNLRPEGHSVAGSWFDWASNMLFNRENRTPLPLHARPYSWFRSEKDYDKSSQQCRSSPSSATEAFEGPSTSAASSSAKMASSNQSRPGLSEEVEGLVAITSYEYERYQRNVKHDKHVWESFMIGALEFDFSRPGLLAQWHQETHPEGASYFYNTKSWDVSVITDVWIHDDPSRNRLTHFVGQILSYIKKHNISLPSDISLVLEFRLSGKCGYYFVDHTAKCLFWLDEFDAMVFLDIVRVKYTPPLVGHEIKALYWLHNVYFPHLRTIPEDSILELKDSLYHAIGDSLTSPSSTTPYDLETLQRMLALVKDIIADGTSTRSGSATTDYYIFSVGYRFLLCVCEMWNTLFTRPAVDHERFLHLHGEQAARLNADQSIHPERHKTLLMKLLSPILLYGPDIHLRHLEEASVDSLVAIRRWTALLQQLTNEWKEFTLYATVLLNANVAFLAIQSVDVSAPPRGHSAMQKASYFSIINNVGAILLGLFLNWQHEARTPSDSRFLANRSHSGVGLETLALLYSLPYALLMWGFVSFLVAFLLMCLHSPDISTIVMLATGILTLLLLFFWAASLSFTGQPSEYGGLLRYFIKEEGIVGGIGRMRA